MLVCPDSEEINWSSRYKSMTAYLSSMCENIWEEKWVMLVDLRFLIPKQSRKAGVVALKHDPKYL